MFAGLKCVTKAAFLAKLLFIIDQCFSTFFCPKKH